MVQLTRRALMGAGAAATAGLVIPAPIRAATGGPIAKTAHGQVRGSEERGVAIFRGIPYGGTISTPAQRFKAPPPPPSWTGIRDATQLGAPAIQASGPTGEPAPSEDCLFLNVWTPAADGGKRPVMFYCHGGGFVIGSGGRPGQDGTNLAREQDVVVVQSNHRLGIFGYLYLGGLLGPEYEGNQGLQDLVAALRWVNENIEAFGGDPNNVMIFGESGGGGKGTCLYGMPSAAPYFNKASIESPIGPGDWSPDQATEVAREAMRLFGLTDPRRLLEVPTADFLRFQTGEIGPPPSPGRGANQRFGPLIDGRVLPELPFRRNAPAISADKPLIVGGLKDETIFFNLADKAVFSLDEAGLRSRLATWVGERADAWIETFRRSRPGASPSQLFIAITTAKQWRGHAVHIAEAKAAQQRAPVYSYVIDYQSPVPVPGTNYPMGAPHAADIALKFNNVTPLAPPAAGGSGFNPSRDQSEGRIRTGRNISTMWASFARTGTPSAPGQPAWKPYTLAQRETMMLKAQCELVRDPEGVERQFWQAEPDAERIS